MDLNVGLSLMGYIPTEPSSWFITKDFGFNSLNIRIIRRCKACEKIQCIVNKNAFDMIGVRIGENYVTVNAIINTRPFKSFADLEDWVLSNIAIGKR